MTPPPQKDGFAMVWWDDFQGPAGSSPNGDLWNIITGPGPANNNEIETYTTLATNVSLSGDGRLILVPIQVPPVGQWTSGRVEGKGPQSCDPNHKMIFEAAIQIGNSGSNGIWPAFWALGESINQGVPWPKCGEWDILETRLDQPWSQSTVHWQDSQGNNQDFVNAQVNYPQGNTNTWTMIMDLTSSDYTQQSLTFQLNGNTFLTATPGAMNAGEYEWSQVTQGGFYPILNIAVGGNNSFPGPTNSNTQGGFASDLAVDYVAIYKSDT
jgi:hypothetical protein